MEKELIVEYIPWKVTKQQLTEGLKRGGNLVVEGVIQRANAKNQNGRIYPREVLQREFDAYNKGAVAEHRATGELDHPECFIPGYLILTKHNGWVDFKDLLGNEEVATINPLTKILEYQQITKVINQEYTGEIINIESKTFQANVTPNHRFITTNGYDLKTNKNLRFKTAEKLFNSPNQLIPKLSNYNQSKIDKVVIENEQGKLEIPSDIFSSFMGWWLAEGWLRTRSKENREGYGIFLSQSDKNPEKVKEITDILEKLCKHLGCNFSIYKKKNYENEFYFFNKILNSYLSQFGLCDVKYIPKEIKSLDKENIQIFLDAYLKADGSKQKNQEVYYTTSPKMANDISELINLTGCMSSISTKKLAFEKYLIEDKWVKDFEWYANKDIFKDKLIEEKKKHYTGKTLYSIRKKYSEFYHISDCTFTKTLYSGKVHCVSVPNETILVMSPNGSTFWSGNSSVINLKNVSHVFTKIWWDGDDVWGRMEILPTPSGNILKVLFMEGITVGVSSRGMGSVKTISEDTVEVQPDFSLLCIDAVSTPSTHGSFMRPLKEGVDLSIKPNKYSKVNDIITEILCNRTNYCSCDFVYNKD